MVVNQLERRHHPRVGFSGITLVRGGGREIPCVAGNLSESGILLYPQLPRRPGPGFQVTFTLPWLSSWIDLKGSLVRAKQIRRRTEWGIQFHNVPTEVLGMLRTYVQRREERTDTSPPEPVEDIPLPPPLPPDRAERITAPLRTTRLQETEADTLTTPAPSFAREAPRSEVPTRTTLRDEIDDDLGASDLPTVITPRGTILSSDGPTRTTNSREASALRNRCRGNN